jgi:ferredoxin
VGPFSSRSGRPKKLAAFLTCGACVPVCPVSVIFALDDLPEKWAEYTAKNAEYFGR